VIKFPPFKVVGSICTHAPCHKHSEKVNTSTSRTQETLKALNVAKRIYWFDSLKGPDPPLDKINTFTSLSSPSQCFSSIIQNETFSKMRIFVMCHLAREKLCIFRGSHHLFLIPRVTWMNKQPKMFRVKRRDREEKRTCLITQFLLICVNYRATLPWESMLS
jgi:hypothetical protein